jgi:hypothetical protein
MAGGVEAPDLAGEDPPLAFASPPRGEGSRKFAARSCAVSPARRVRGSPPLYGLGAEDDPFRPLLVLKTECGEARGDVLARTADRPFSGLPTGTAEAHARSDGGREEPDVAKARQPSRRVRLQAGWLAANVMDRGRRLSEV